MPRPDIQEPLSVFQLEQDEVWVSADGAWAILPRATLEKRVGRRLLPTRPTTQQLEEDLGMSLEPSALRGVGGSSRVKVPEPIVVPDEVPVRRDALRAQARHVDAVEDQEPDEAERVWRWSLVALGVVAAMALVGVGLLAFGIGRVTAGGGEGSAVLVPVDQLQAVRLPKKARPARAARDTAVFSPTLGPEGSAPGVGLRQLDPASVVVPGSVPGQGPAGASASPGARTAPPAWQVHIDNGWSLLDLDPVAAADVFRRAIAMNPRHGDAHLGLGEALLRVGDVAGGAAYVCEAERLDRALAARVEALTRAAGVVCDGR